MDDQLFVYEGRELELFRHAVNWKSYWGKLVRPFIRGHVLEVGAGLGENIGYLINPDVLSWLSLEPDATLASAIRLRLAKIDGSKVCQVRQGFIADIDPAFQFDTILYLDVLEHIDGDEAEVLEASRRLRPGGRIIVLSPAHQWLFSPFDAEVGHFRRYTKRSLGAILPRGWRTEALLYLDSAGMLASAFNRFIKRSAHATHRDIAIWDRFLVPVSTVIDPLTLNGVGKSVLGIWKKEPPPAEGIGQGRAGATSAFAG